MEVVKLFNSELSSLYEAKPPISKAKMTSITRTAIKAIKFYKHVVQSVEKFIQKCKPEYKVPGLYVIDSIVRQSRHQFGTEKDVFAPRFARNLQTTFIHLFNCPPEDKSKVIRVLNLWQKNSVFESDVIQPLFDLADPNHPIHKEQSINNVPSNGITPSKLSTNTSKTPPSIKSSSKDTTASWANQSSHMEPASLLTTPLEKKHTPSSGQQSSMIDVNLIQQLQQLQTLLDQRTDNSTTPTKKESDQVKFDKKLLDFDYGEEEDEDAGAGSGNVIAALAQSHSQSSSHHQQHQQQVSSSLDSLGSILSNPEVLRQLQNLQVQLSQQQLRQQYESEEKMRKLQEMRQQEEEFDKHLAQTVPNLPFADECDFKPNQDISPSMSLHHQAFMSQIQGLTFPGMDLSQPPPGYGMTQQKLMGSPLEDGEHASSDLDERIGIRKNSEEGGGAVVIIDSESPSDSPAHRRRRRRSNSRSHHRSRSDSRSRSRSKRKRSRSYEKEHDKDFDRTKDREMEKEKERERRRKGLPPLKRNHLAVCSTTLWIGHLSKLVQQEELSDTFGEYGDIVSIDLIPPRGCAFICMNRRQDAHKALQQLRHHKLQGKAITLAWAPGKGMKGKEWKDYWEVEQGVSFIPWNKISRDVDLEILEEGGMLDEESFPDWLREKQRKIKEEQQKSQNSSQTGDEDKSESNKMSGASELDIPVPAPTLPGYIPLPDGPQPNDIKTSQAPPSMPAMMPPAPTAMPPMGMMPPFGIHNVPRLLGPMGMTMGPAGLMPNVPMGVPPPGLMANQLMHQQMMSRMPQPVGSPFNAPPGVGLLGHPQLSQIPLPTPQGQEANKARLMSSTSAADLSSFTESMLQLPFTLPPQLQLQASGIGVIQSQLATLDRPSTPMDVDSDPNTSKEDETSTPSRSLNNSMANSPFNRPPPHFSPMSLMQIPPPMNLPPPNKAIESNNNSTDKDERESHDKDYRSGPKETRGVRDEKEKDFRSNRGKDGDYKNYRDRNDKDFRERDSRDRSRDHEYRDRDRRDTRRDRDRNSNDKNDSEMRNNRDSRSKEAEDGKENELKRDKGPNARDDDDRGYRDRSRNRDRDRDRDRNRDRGGRWNDRDKEKDDRSRERLNQSGRDKDSGKRKDDQPDNRDKSIPSLQERLRNLAHDQNRPGEFARRGRSPVNENMIPPLLPPPTGGMDPNDMPFHGPPRGPMFGSRNMGDGFGPQDMHNRHPDEFGHRGGPRGSRDGFDGRGPSRGSMPPEDFDNRGPPPLNNFNPRGPPPDGFDPRGPPPDGFDPRGPPHEGFGAPMEGFGPPRQGPPPGFNPQGSEDFHPRIRIEFFPRRGMGHPDNFMRMKGRGPMGPGPLFPPRGPPPGPMGMRGPRPGMWMDGPGFPPRGFPPPDGPPNSEEFFRRSPVFEESGRGRGETNARGMARGRGFQGRSSERRKEEGEGKRSRWSNASPSPPRRSKSPVSADTPTMKTEDSKQHEDLPSGEKSEDSQNIKHEDNSRLSEIIIKSKENINIDNVSDISVKHESVSECQKLEICSTVTELPLFAKFEPTEEHSSLTETLQELGPSCTESIKERRTSNAEPIPIQTPSYSEPLQERCASNTEPMTEHHSPHAETDISENKNEPIFPEFEHKLAQPSNQHEQKLPTVVKLDQNLPEDKVQDSYLTKHEPYSFLEEKKPVVRSIDTSCQRDQERRLSSAEQEREITLMEQEVPSFVDETSHLPPVQTQSFCESDFDIEPRNSDDQDFLCPLSELPEESIMPDIPSAIETIENEFRIETSDQEITKPVNTVESYTTTSDETDIEK